MEWISNIFSYLLFINIVLALAVVFLERRNVAATWSWLMVLLFVPVVGFVLYVMLGQNLSRRKLYKWNRIMLERVQQLTLEQTKQLHKGTLLQSGTEMPLYRDLISLNLTTNYSFVTQDNDIDIFTDGNAKFAALLQSISEAQDHIHMQYYIVKNDELGKKIVDALAVKAQQGVEVRFLYDDIGSRSIKESFFRKLLEAGGEVAAFFPSRIPFLNYRVNYRNHRKLAIIDGKIGYIGGLNIGREYIGLDPAYGYWRDTHLKLQGSVVRALQARFVLDWNLAAARQIEQDHGYFPELHGHGPPRRLPMQVIASGPNERWPHIAFAYLKMIHAARHSILIQTPYFIPEETMMNALKMAALSGIDVSIMIPQKADHLFVHWASLYYVGELLQAGVKCYLYVEGFLHAKTIVVDGKIASVGTANFDNRSLRLNFETNVIIYDEAASVQLAQAFERDIEQCAELTQEEYDKRSYRVRFLESISKLISPIL